MNNACQLILPSYSLAYFISNLLEDFCYRYDFAYVKTNKKNNCTS